MGNYDTMEPIDTWHGMPYCAHQQHPDYPNSHFIGVIGGAMSNEAMEAMINGPCKILDDLLAEWLNSEDAPLIDGETGEILEGLDFHDWYAKKKENSS